MTWFLNSEAELTEQLELEHVWIGEKVEVDRFPGDRDSVYIRIAFPFKSYIGALGTSANEKNDQRGPTATAQLPALFSP